MAGADQSKIDAAMSGGVEMTIEEAVAAAHRVIEAGADPDDAPTYSSENACFLARAVLALAKRQLPALRWEGETSGATPRFHAYLGSIKLATILPMAKGRWYLLIRGLDDFDTAADSEPEARAAVEAAVWQALGMDMTQPEAPAAARVPSGTSLAWLTSEVGTETYPCLGHDGPARNLGQLVQQIDDFTGCLSHEDTCDLVRAFIVRHQGAAETQAELARMAIVEGQDEIASLKRRIEKMEAPKGDLLLCPGCGAYIRFETGPGSSVFAKILAQDAPQTAANGGSTATKPPEPSALTIFTVEDVVRSALEALAVEEAGPSVSERDTWT